MLISHLIARATKIQSTTGGNSFVLYLPHPALLEPIEHIITNILIRSRPMIFMLSWRSRCDSFPGQSSLSVIDTPSEIGV